MTTLGVVQEIDVRAFPMEIAKKMLTLGEPLSMSKGVTAYYEAERSVQGFLESLSIFHKTLWPGDIDFRNQLRAVEKFIQVHRTNGNLLASQARQLLDFMHFFPNPEEYPYEIVLDEDERHDSCSQND